MNTFRFTGRFTETPDPRVKWDVMSVTMVFEVEPEEPYMEVWAFEEVAESTEGFKAGDWVEVEGYLRPDECDGCRRVTPVARSVQFSEEGCPMFVSKDD